MVSADGIEIRVPTDDDLASMVRLDTMAFAAQWTPEEVDRVRPILDLSRFRIAVDGRRVVGVAGSFGFDMTLPGGGTVPTGGVTWVAVLVTHRRRGILRRMIEAVHADIAERDEPLAALYASEGAIYERFGYGVASRQRLVEIDRRRARFRVDPPAGTVDVETDPDRADGTATGMASRWDRFRLTRPGEVDRSDAWWTKLRHDRGTSAVHALHDDGHAVWKVTPHWGDGHPSHRLDLLELAATTADAHLALWDAVLSVDLVGTVSSWSLPLDDPLPYLLDDPRIVRTREVNDALWLSVRDVGACFDARTYGVDGDIVVEVEGTRWRLGTSGCRRVRSRPDLETDGPGLSALLLGGVRPSELAAGRRLTARSPEALRRADTLFALAPLPHSQTFF
ncbi:MAG: GNAT family N-acetyltransferase [Ilumatobacteraceae bacterium]